MVTADAVTPHQDSSFLHTEPMKIVGVWLALEDVTLDNGCLWFIPGSHQRGIDRRFIRNPDPESSNLTMYTAPNPDYDHSKFIAGPVPKGETISLNQNNLMNRYELFYEFFFFKNAFKRC